MRYNLRQIGTLLILTSMLLTTKVEALQDDYRLYLNTPYSNDELHCLALNVYFESRGESSLGQEAVAWVTINRSNSPEYPDSICDVVYDRGQFSWVKDKNSNKPTDQKAWARALYIAYSIYKDHMLLDDPTNGAVMFHTSNSKPSWRKSYILTTKIDSHIFYKEKTTNG